MIYMDDINKFSSVIGGLKSSGVPVFLYGYEEETFSGAYAGLDTPPNNTLIIRIVALTSVGTIYCNSHTKLKDPEKSENAKRIYQQLSVSDAHVSYDKDSGTVSIK